MTLLASNASSQQSYNIAIGGREAWAENKHSSVFFCCIEIITFDTNDSISKLK